MSLLNSLYSIDRREQTEYTVHFDASHPIFAGHFPEQAIVPGACLVQIAEELAGLTVGQPVRFTALRNVKFRQPVTPDQIVTYILLPCPEESITVQLFISDINCASFKATYMCPDSDVQ